MYLQKREYHIIKAELWRKAFTVILFVEAEIEDRKVKAKCQSIKIRRTNLTMMIIYGALMGQVREA